MSHFTVLVVTATGSKDDITKALAPFHEYECTGIDDEFVVDVDRTADLLQEFAKATVIRMKGPDGTLHDRFDAAGNWKTQFSKLKDDGRFVDRVEFVPPGYERVEVPASDVMAAADWISDHHGWPISGEEAVGNYGYIQIDAQRNVVKCIDRTNPNAKWDWWQIGGRWANMLRTTAGSTCDSARKRDLAMAAMQEAARLERLAAVRRVYARIKAKTGASDEQITRDWATFTALRTKLFNEYNSVGGTGIKIWDYAKQQSSEFARLYEVGIVDIGFNFDSARVPEDEPDPFAWVEKATALNTFAFLGLDGVWRERGQMGWWACVSDEKQAGDWEAEYAKALDEVPEDHFLTIVDCHI